jgi:hypothetical protein
MAAIANPRNRLPWHPSARHPPWKGRSCQSSPLSGECRTNLQIINEIPQIETMETPGIYFNTSKLIACVMISTLRNMQE